MPDTNPEGRLQHTIAGLQQRIAQLEKALLAKKTTEQALIASEKRYRRLFESAKDGILILDADTGKVVDANPFLTELLGFSHEALCGQHLWELGVFKDIAASKEAFQTLQDNHYIRYEDLPLETRDGRAIAVEFVSNVYLVDHSRVIQCNIRDITAQKRERAEHLRLTAQLQQAQKMESVGLLAGGVAHEYNNMLTVILGYAELALQKAASDQSLAADIKEIIKAGKRSAEITRQLLAVARKQTITPVVFDLNQAVKNMLIMLQRLLGEEIALVFLAEKSACPVKLDPIQFGQILINLCANAKDAISGIGKVTIVIGKAVLDEAYCLIQPGIAPGEYMTLTVSDDGCGIDGKRLDHIFDPFFTSKEVGRGTGLGLSIVYGIVKQNQGFIKAASEPGKGAEFKIYLPRATGQIADINKAAMAAIPQSLGETVLIVEDEPELLEMAGRMLDNLGYRVLIADNPKAAIGLVMEHQDEINLLLTDVVMPKMNGRELAEQSQTLIPGLKVLFMSGYSSNVVTDRGVLTEGVNFIEKPFSIENLAIKVRAALNNNRRPM